MLLWTITELVPVNRIVATPFEYWKVAPPVNWVGNQKPVGSASIVSPVV